MNRLIKQPTHLLCLVVTMGGMLVAAPASSQTQAASTTAAAVPAACAHCVDARVFTAEVTGLSPSWNHYHNQHFLRVNLRFTNTGTAPIILAFPWRSTATVTDNFGNAYAIDWRFPQNIVGIGIVSNQEANANFVVAPGASRDASLIFNRPTKGTEVGNVFTIDVSVSGLKVLAGSNQVKKTGDYALNFPDVTASATGQASDLGKRIGDVLGAFGKKR